MTEMQKPFSKDYVIRITARHMKKSIDISLKKTVERIGEFSEDKEKSVEIFETLSFLHDMKRQIDEFQNQCAEQFKGE